MNNDPKNGRLDNRGTEKGIIEAEKPPVRRRHVQKPENMRQEKQRTLRIEQTNSVLPAALMLLVQCIEEEVGDKLLRRNLYFAPSIYEKIMYLLKNGCTVITDSAVTAAKLQSLFEGMDGVQLRCFIGDPDVQRMATERRVTRAEVALEKAVALPGPKLLVIGSAPTAVGKLLDLHAISPLYDIAVIAAVEGHAGMIELKEKLIESGISCMVVRGKKGGSEICRSIVHQLILAAQRE